MGGSEAIGFELPSLAWPCCLDAVSAFDDVGFETDGAGSAMEFEEEPAGVAEHGAEFISSPEWCCARCAVLTDRLYL